MAGENLKSEVRKRKATSGVVVPQAPKWHQRLGAWIIYAAVRTVAGTIRYTWIDRSGFAADQAIYCVWHNRLALCLKAYSAYARPRAKTRGLAALVSASRDGAFLAGILECFGVQPVRGSSSRRGAQALLELTSWAERGYDLAITPDGPRGPCYLVQEGAIALAQMTGLPLIPASYSVSWKWRARSWDRFIVPLPFARCEVIIGKPIRVPREVTDEEREALRKQFEGELRAITRDE